MVVAARVPAAPVEASTSTVSWPPAGAAPRSTTLFLVPYRPATLTATVPCAAVNAGRARTGTTILLATSTGDPGQALVVRTAPTTAAGSAAREVEVIADGRQLPVTVPAEGCDLGVRADAAGLTVTVGDPHRPSAVWVPGDPVPEVFAAVTDLTGADADGLALTARTPSWFDNPPAPAKSSLIASQYQLATAALLLIILAGLLTPARSGGWTGGELTAARVAARAQSRLRQALARTVSALARPWGLARGVVDAGVALGLVWWSIVGPLTDDDGFAAVIARHVGAGGGGVAGGEVGNFYRWFDASEVPFASGQRLLALFLQHGLAPVALRTPSVLAGFALWLVLTRGVLGPALRPLRPTRAATMAVRLLAAVALATWWLPYDLGTRPEPLVALGSTVVAALLLRAAVGVGHPHRMVAPAALVALAALVAGLTVTVAPSGLICAAPLLLLGPRLLRTLHLSGDDGEPGRAGRVIRWLAPAAGVAVIAGMAAVAVVVVFSDQSWHGLLVATAVHAQIGPDQPWYAEWLRYSYLFGDDSWGAAAKRVPVLLGLVLSAVGLVLLARRTRPTGTPPSGAPPGGPVAAAGPSTGAGQGRGGQGWGELAGGQWGLLLGLAPAGFAALAITPSKWSHHFGALAGYGAIGLVAAAVALTHAARRADRGLAVTGGLATIGIALGAAFAFAGPNAWWGYSDFGMPGATGPQHPFDSVGLWLAVTAGIAALVALAGWGLRRRTRDAGRADPAAAAITEVAVVAPAVTAVVVAVTSVALLVSSFTAAADRAGYSLAAQNRAAAADPSSPGACGLEDRVQVLQTDPNGPLTPIDGSAATMTGFVAGGGAASAPPVRPGQTDGSHDTADTRDGRYSWGSRTGAGAGSVGSLTTGWFALPRLRPGQELAISVAGRSDDGNTLAWQFGRGEQPVGTAPVIEAPQPDRGYRGYAPTPAAARLQDQHQNRDPWRTVTLTPSQVPAGADQVRLRATDGRTDPGGWLAVTGPRVDTVIPLRRWLAGRGPILVDWSIAFAWPCTGPLPHLADGVAATPGVFITAPTGPPDPNPGDRLVEQTPPGDVLPERWTLGTDALTTGRDSGGSFAGLTQVAALRELDTRLPDDPTRRWGRVLVPDLHDPTAAVSSDLAADAYTTTRTTTTHTGTTGDPPPVPDPAPAAPAASP